MTRDLRSRDTLTHFTSHGGTSTQTATDTEHTRHTTLPSPDRPCTTHQVEIGQYPIPQIQGVVPGIRRFGQPTSSSHSLIPPRSTANKPIRMQDKTVCPSANETALQNTHSRRSTYPRASPPVFLYPSSIVPYTFQPSTEHTRCTYTHQPQPRTPALSPPSMQRSNASLATSLPTSLKAIFLITIGVIALGVIWSIITFCIISPPSRWRMFRRRQRNGNVVEHTQAQEEGIELQIVSRNARHNVQPPESTPTRRHSHVWPQDDNPFSSRSRLSVAESPYNPFLDPPAARGVGVQRPRRAYGVRSSREWREAHAAFFSGERDMDGSYVLEIPEAAERNMGGKEGMEEGVSASVKEQREGRGGGQKGRSDKGSGDDGLTAKGVKWVDETLEMLDGAVGEAAVGIARSTDDKKVG